MNSTKRLDEVCVVIMGQAPSGDDYNTDGGGWPLLAGAGDFGESTPSPKKYTTQASKVSKAGDIILGIRASIGQKVISDSEYCLGRGVAALRPIGPLDARYLWHWLTHITPQLTAKARGATFKQVNRGDIGEIPITLPALHRQQQIAAELDMAEELRARRRKALVRLDEFVQSVFLDMFGEIDSCGGISTTVAGVAHADKGSIRTGPFGSQLLHSEFVDSGIAVLGIDNVVTNEFRWVDRRYVTETKYAELNRYTVRPGDVLITIMGTCGRCAVAPEDIPLAINTKHLCCITLNHERCLPVFLHAYFLRHPVARRYLDQTAKGAIMSGLNMGIIKAMPLLLPPLPLQQEFVDLVDSVERLKVSHRAHLAELDALFASLQYRAFRGEL